MMHSINFDNTWQADHVGYTPADSLRASSKFSLENIEGGPHSMG